MSAFLWNLAAIPAKKPNNLYITYITYITQNINHNNLGGLCRNVSNQGWANVAMWHRRRSGLMEQRGPQLPGLQAGGRLASGPSQQGGGQWIQWGIPGLIFIYQKTVENHHLQ